MNVQSSPFRVLCGKKYTDFKKYIIVVVAVVTNINNIMTDFQSKNFSGVHRPPFNVSWDSPRNVTGAAPGMTSEPPRNPMVDTAFSFDESKNV